MKRRTNYQNVKKAFFTQDDGTIGCKCERRKAPKPFKKSLFEKAFAMLSKMEGNLSDNCADFLRAHFQSSSMNICQTQHLSMMNVQKMTVEFKEGSKGMKAKRTSRVIPVPLAMREQTKKDLDSAVKMGILDVKLHRHLKNHFSIKHSLYSVKWKGTCQIIVQISSKVIFKPAQ